MELSINITGEGIVEKVVDSDIATLTPIASENWTFKHFIVNGTIEKDVPCTVKVSENPIVEALFYVTIEEYLRGLVGFDVEDSVLNSIRLYRDVKKASDSSELSMKLKDLLYADLLMWASTSPTSYTGVKDSDGGWTHTEASKTISITDKKRFENLAMSIYKKYLDRKYSSNIKIVNLW